MFLRQKIKEYKIFHPCEEDLYKIFGTGRAGIRKLYKKALKKEVDSRLTDAQRAGLEKGKALARSGKLKPPPPLNLNKKQKETLKENRKLESKLKRSKAAVDRMKINVETGTKPEKLKRTKNPKDYSKVKVKDVPYGKMETTNQCHMDNKRSYLSRNIPDTF